MGEPVRLSCLMQSGKRIKVRGTLVAANLASHRPAGQSIRHRFDVTQISSGLRVARFAHQEDAADFARAVLMLVPELGTAEPLTDEQWAMVRQVRGTYGGHPW